MYRLVIKDESSVALVDCVTGEVKQTFKSEVLPDPPQDSEIDGQLSIEGMIT